MATPAKTTSSSIPCRTNPNMKKSELCDPTRRSFSGNPFTKPAVITDPRAFNPKTPANSPSDFPRRHSTGRGSVESWRDLGKENSKDQNPKPTRLRSPAPSKGTKNFMVPTISAASKINASPRKKVLVERNEQVRSSVSFSDIKGLTMEDDKSTPEIALKQKMVSFSDVRSLIMEDNESTPEVGLNQKVSFVGVKSIISEDNESTRQTGLKPNNVKMPHELQSNYHEYNYKEPFKSNADVESIILEDNESTQQTRLKQHNDELTHELQSNNHECKESLKSNVDSLMETFKVIPSFKISPEVSVLAPLDADPLMLPYDPKTNCLSPRPQFLHYRPNPRIKLYRERDCKQLDECFTTESSFNTDFTEETQPEDSLKESEDVSSEDPIAAATVEKGLEDRRMSKPRFPTRSKFISLLLILAFAYLSVLAANSPAFTSNLEELSLLNFHVPPEFKRSDADEEQKNEDFKTLELVSEEETVAVEQEIGAEMIELDRLDHPSIIIPQATETMFPEEDSTYNSQNSEDDSTINGPQDRFLAKNTTGFALLVLCLTAASALIYTKRGKPSMPMKQPVSTGPKDKLGLKEPNEYQSQERKTSKTHRRESLASSDYSMGSSSNGSFTTYDKIPSKHGGGDEITPVRRSSRIRNQATSP
ncbi:hypothetical protein HRI_002041800 [Hibiscus trionum]|uniref:Uncharacterized protein n=1 Tax=Hibiscus trionum TaxID=183268 RepID=A0A9W7HXH9_HIBTR|nr:hypothetical protein HRI_002041800 [Hibiscus trionum]